MDGFTWVGHAETGGVWACPDAVLGEMAVLGWLPCDPPEQLDPAAIEHRIQQAARAEAADAQAAQETKSTTKAAASGKPEKE